MPQVSILFLTYNSEPAQMRRALTAIAEQKGVELEIIISDDGSSTKDFSFLPDFMGNLGFNRWQLLEHPVNRGTVYNCLFAAKAATGEYVFTTSPGDFLFDEYVLHDFYQFAQQHSSVLCFGNAVYYSCQNGKAERSSRYGHPLRPQHYRVNAPFSCGKTAFFSGDWVVGACYFYKLAQLRESLEAIAGKIVYTEDTPTTMFLMAQGYRLSYYDRNMVWYEHGTGISTSGSSKWDQLLSEDIRIGYQLLKERFPKNPYIDYALYHSPERSRAQRIFKKLIYHPFIMLRLYFLRWTPKKEVSCTGKDWERLTKLLKIQ